MKHNDALAHVSGRSIYLDDIPVQKGCLYAHVFYSPLAHARILSLDVTQAAAIPGVVAVYTAKDIPGENQIGGIVPDEPLLAENEVHFQGQPVALVIATDSALARDAARKIIMETEELEVITDPREAHKKGLFLVPPRLFETGDVDKVWDDCAYVFEGRTESGGQEHLYIETQGAYACPTEHGSLRIHSSTQGPTAVQRTAAQVLGIPMHRVEVDVTRLGGGFGGKEDQATAWACMVALAAFHLNRPVKISLHRADDLRMTGKRHPYSADFRIGLSKDLRILAYETTLFQNGGAAADLSPAILDRSLFHATNAYFVPNARIKAYSCRTNLPPNTAFRGFGGPQGMFVIESAIAHAAFKLDINPAIIQERNFLGEGDQFPYGQVTRQARIRACYDALVKEFDPNTMQKQVDDYNRNHSESKKGLAMMPVCFGISFTNKPMNQARALLHIYQDGSIGFSTGAIEMGQGVNTKLIQVVSGVFSVDAKRIKAESTNTTRVANTSPTAASSGADLNGKALQLACESLRDRLLGLAADILDVRAQQLELREEWVWCNDQITELHWEKLIEKAYQQRLSLSEAGHYATPGIHFDSKTSKGNPFAYHVYGVALVQAHVDCLRGRYQFDKVCIVHDFGNSLNPQIDLGQVEGGLVQGLGWMTLEEVAYDEKGRLLSDSLSTYKIPDIYSAPRIIECVPLESPGPEQAIMRSKAVGEPPLMYGIGGFFALQQAIRAFNPGWEPDFDAPMTPGKLLLRLYSDNNLPDY